MKKFLLFIGTFILLYVLTVICLRVIWIELFPQILTKNVIDKNIHTIVIGASNGETSWNDSIIVGTKNLAQSGRTYMSNLTTLRYAVEYNECSIDTVIVCAGMPSFLYYTKDIIGKYERLISDEKTSLLSYEAFFNCHKDEGLYWKALLTQNPLLKTSRIPAGRFVKLERDKLGDPRAYESINKRLLEFGGKNGFTEEYIREHCRLQIMGLRMIHDYCERNNIVLILYNSPIYKIPDMVSDRGYKDFIHSEFGDSILIANYADYQFPDTSYYGDLEHVNCKGANLLSNDINNNGLNLQYSINYCK